MKNLCSVIITVFFAGLFSVASAASLSCGKEMNTTWYGVLRDAHSDWKASLTLDVNETFIFTSIIPKGAYATGSIQSTCDQNSDGSLTIRNTVNGDFLFNGTIEPSQPNSMKILNFIIEFPFVKKPEPDYQGIVVKQP